MDKLLRSLLYHQEMLVNMNFKLAKMSHPPPQKKKLSEKAATIKRFG